MKLICFGIFLIGTVLGTVAGSGASSSTQSEEPQHTIIKEYFREEFDDEGKWYGWISPSKEILICRSYSFYITCFA